MPEAAAVQVLIIKDKAVVVQPESAVMVLV
jgi:hypothetical protein